MINFYFETNSFNFDEEATLKWIDYVISSEGKKIGEISYIFCDDTYLHKINIDYLQHDTLTDIISFDYSLGNTLSGDIFISIERVAENAETFKVSFIEELRRVLIHGVLHYCGYKDKVPAEQEEMRAKENTYLAWWTNHE